MSVGDVRSDSDNENDDYPENDSVQNVQPVTPSSPCVVQEEQPRPARGRRPNMPNPAKQTPSSNIDLSLEAVRGQQLDDECLSKVIKLKTENSLKPSRDVIAHQSPEFKFWISRWELLEIVNDVLCIKWEYGTNDKVWRIIAPRSLVKHILWFLHTAGHMGIRKTFEKGSRSPYYWYEMLRSVSEYVNHCHICGERKSPNKKKRHELNSFTVGGRFERLPTDIQGPMSITEQNKNRYILVVGDYFSKWIVIYPMADMQPETVADIIFRGWIKRYG